MKQLPPALAGLPEEQRAEALELLRQWKMHTWLYTGITASVATALFLLMYRGMEEYGIFSVLAAVLLPVSLIYVLELGVLERIFTKKLRQIPELNCTTNANTSYLAAAQQTPRPDGVQIVLMVLMCVLFFPLGIALALIYDRRRREAAIVHLTPADALRDKASRHARSLGCSGFLLFCFAAAGMLLQAMMGSVAISKRSALNTNARSVCTAANTYLDEMYDKCTPITVPAGTYIVHGSDTFKEGSLEWGIAYYFSDSKRQNVWYALKFDENGTAVAAWFAHHPLTEAELVPTDPDEQRRLLSSFTHQDEAVGYYPYTTEKKQTMT